MHEWEGLKYMASEKRGRWEWNLEENERISFKVRMGMFSWVGKGKGSDKIRHWPG